MNKGDFKLAAINDRGMVFYSSEGIFSTAADAIENSGEFRLQAKSFADRNAETLAAFVVIECVVTADINAIKWDGE